MGYKPMPRIVVASLVAWAIATAHASDGVDKYNVVWDSPSVDSAGSMPVGNGDIGLNVWVEKGSGDTLFYIGKTDAWGDDVQGNDGLPKVGRVRVKMSPSPFAGATDFRQELKLRQGRIEISGRGTVAKVWVDANQSVIHVQVESETPVEMEAGAEVYRNERDEIFHVLRNQVGWCHRNRSDQEPLKGLTFGALIMGKDLVSRDDVTLKSSSPQKRFDVQVCHYTAKVESDDAWLKQASKAAEDAIWRSDARFHEQFWKDFWGRSWMFVDGDEAAEKVTRGHVLQRFVSACAGRGKYPIKFNGSIFTADITGPKGEKWGADYRTWGGCYWLQNTRCMYWPMLEAGDFEEMRPLFEMYRGMVETNRALVKKYYGHEGVYFAETSPFWGGLQKLDSDTPGYYVGHYYTPVLELSAMMLDYAAYTGDENFLREQAIPMAEQGLTFFDQHFRRDEKGKIVLEPDNAIETFWKVRNPLPDVAGLRWVLGKLLELPPSVARDSKRREWQRMLGELPEMPRGVNDGKPVLVAYESAKDVSIHNSENPELYAVYPFRHFGLGKPDLLTARFTFALRRVKQTGCWCQDAIQAAYLGDVETAKKDVLINFTAQSKQMRFPAFWESGSDYMPDEDNGGNAMNALQLMLMQCEGKRILLLPAWPKEWGASFRLHAPMQTVVEGVVRGGKVEELKVTPDSRRGDVEVMQ